MNAGAALLRSQCDSIEAAIHWACILEATAPKLGNVHPGKSFDDLRYADFVIAAEIASRGFARFDSFSIAVKQACEDVADHIGTNVNLGILLLIGPLAQAAQELDSQTLELELWRTQVDDVLTRLTADDAENLYRAIQVSAPGGMGDQDEMDVAGPAPDSFMDAMRLAKDRDRIALNYSTGFQDFFEQVVPVLQNNVKSKGDLLDAIAATHLDMLSRDLDTLIVRKHGLEVAEDVRNRVRTARNNPSALAELDDYLRGHTHHRGKINPGTTADLIAAALFVMLCLSCSKETHSHE